MLYIYWLEIKDFFIKLLLRVKSRSTNNNGYLVAINWNKLNLSKKGFLVDLTFHFAPKVIVTPSNSYA